MWWKCVKPRISQNWSSLINLWSFSWDCHFYGHLWCHHSHQAICRKQILAAPAMRHVRINIFLLAKYTYQTPQIPMQYHEQTENACTYRSGTSLFFQIILHGIHIRIIRRQVKLDHFILLWSQVVARKYALRSFAVRTVRLTKHYYFLSCYLLIDETSCFRHDGWWSIVKSESFITSRGRLKSYQLTSWVNGWVLIVRKDLLRHRWSDCNTETNDWSICKWVVTKARECSCRYSVAKDQPSAYKYRHSFVHA